MDRVLMARIARFEREADPDGVLDLAERGRRADALFAGHMLRLSRASARARRAPRAPGER